MGLVTPFQDHQYNRLCTWLASRAIDNSVEMAYISYNNLQHTFEKSAVNID